VEVESKTVVISGEEYSFRANFRCLLEYEKLSEKSVNDIQTLNDSAIFLFCGVKAGMLFDKKEFKLTFDEFIDQLDDIDVLDVLNDGLKEKKKIKKVEKQLQ